MVNNFDGGCSLGDCAFCSKNADCVALSIHRKLENLERLLMETAGQPQ